MSQVILPNCVVCGRFVGWRKSRIAYTPFGGALDLDPPDPRFMHMACWDKLSDREHEFYRSPSWYFIPASIEEGSDEGA